MSFAANSAVPRLFMRGIRFPPSRGLPYPFVLKVEKARDCQPSELKGTYHLGWGTFLVTQTQSEHKAVVSEELIQ